MTRSRLCFHFTCFALAVVTGIAVGCGRASPPASASAPPPVPGSPANNVPGSGVRPTQADVAAFFGEVYPPTAVRAEVQSDTPTADPRQPGRWLMAVKVTFIPVADLYDQPAEADVTEVNALVAERNALVDWRNQFAQSDFFKSHYSNLQIGGPPTPPFIILKHPKGQPLPPRYGKVAAERLVDHWQFQDVNLDLSGLDDIGELRAKFPANAVVLGSPAAQAFLAAEREAIAQAKAWQVEAASAYRAMVTAATAPGTRYVGTITHGLGTVAAEVRFGPRPGGQDDNAAFLVTLPNDLPYTLAFTGSLNRTLPMEASVADLRTHVVRTPNNGKSNTTTVPGTMVNGMDTATERTFTFSRESMEGVVSGFGSWHKFSGKLVK